MSLGAIPSDILFLWVVSGQDKKIVTSMTDNDQSTQKWSRWSRVVKVVTLVKVVSLQNSDQLTSKRPTIPKLIKSSPKVGNKGYQEINWGISGEFLKTKIANKLNFNLLAIILVPKKGTYYLRVVVFDVS